MTNRRLIHYEPSDLAAFFKGFERERGFLGIFLSLVSEGRIFGVVDAPPTTAVDPRSGYVGTAGSSKFLLSKIIESFLSYDPNAALLAQDVWALESDYEAELLANAGVLVIDGSVYLPTKVNAPIDEILDTILSGISFTAVIVFLDADASLASTSTLAQHAFAVAISAYDRQGWLLWAKQSAIATLLEAEGWEP